MLQTFNASHTFNGRTLSVFAVSLHGQAIPDWLNEEIQTAFEKLAPYFKNENQAFYLRDIKFLAIDGKYPGGHCYNAYEAMIAVPNWEADKEQIIATINHELHHMARWQNPGYGSTLGGAILSEGIATYYEEFVSGWSPPWSQVAVSSEALAAVLKEWNSKKYNHPEWFFKGEFGRWVGYTIGYQLAKSIFNDKFDLAKSVQIKPDEVENLLSKIQASV